MQQKCSKFPLHIQVSHQDCAGPSGPGRGVWLAPSVPIFHSSPCSRQSSWPEFPLTDAHSELRCPPLTSGLREMLVGQGVRAHQSLTERVQKKFHLTQYGKNVFWTRKTSGTQQDRLLDMTHCQTNIYNLGLFITSLFNLKYQNWFSFTCQVNYSSLQKRANGSSKTSQGYCISHQMKIWQEQTPTSSCRTDQGFYSLNRAVNSLYHWRKIHI